MLGIKNATKKYVGNTIFEQVTLYFRLGHYYTLTGPNGSGKSTIMSSFLQHTGLTEGELMLDGRQVKPGNKEYAQQVFGINDSIGWLPGVTVGEHLELIRAQAQTFTDTVDPLPTAKDALEQLGVPQAYDRQPYTLSSGQEQRSRLASLLLRPARYYFLDEPEKRLDAAGVQWIAQWAQAQIAQGAMVCIATHDPNLMKLPCATNIIFPMESAGLGSKA